MPRTLILFDDQDLRDFAAGTPFRVEPGAGVTLVAARAVSFQASPSNGHASLPLPPLREPVISPARKGRHRKFTDEQKQMALRYATEHGVRAASRKFQVHTASLSRWRRQ